MTKCTFKKHLNVCLYCFFMWIRRSPHDDRGPWFLSCLPGQTLVFVKRLETILIRTESKWIPLGSPPAGGCKRGRVWCVMGGRMMEKEPWAGSWGWEVTTRYRRPHLNAQQACLEPASSRGVGLSFTLKLPMVRGDKQGWQFLLASGAMPVHWGLPRWTKR